MTYVSDSFEHSQGVINNEFLTKGKTLLQKTTKAPHLLLTHSCTAALEIAALLIDLKPDDEIIMPSYTFVSTANAFVLRGAKPVFVDIRPDNLNINEKLIEAAITKKTKAIVPMHYAGNACDMHTILKIAKAYNLYVIEDAAQCIGSYHQGKHLGTFGDFGTLSFHHTKNISSGFGGALLINNENFIDRAKVIWQKGTNREAFLSGEVDKYTWVDVGSSYMMSELSAARLLGQLEYLDEISKKRKALWDFYYQSLAEIPNLPCYLPENQKANAHIFYVLMKTAAERAALLKSMKRNGVQCTFHYSPLHLSPMGMRFHNESALPITESCAKSIIRLPMFYELTHGEQEKVIHHLHTPKQKSS